MMNCFPRYLIGICAALCMTGCIRLAPDTPAPPRPQSATPVTPPRPQSATTVTPQTGNKVEHTTTELPSTETRLVVSMEDKLRVSFKSSSMDAGHAAVCRKVADECAQAILPQKARIVTDGKADMTILTDCEFKEKSAFGDFALLECQEFRLRIIDIREEELASMIVVHPKPMPRQLGRDEAMNQYVQPISKELIPRITAEISRIANENINVEDVTFLVKCSPATNATDEFRREIQRIKGVMDNESGILNWELVSQDADNQRCRFRVLYKKGSFREGLANKLGFKLAVK